MRLPYVLIATVLALSDHQVPITASGGSDVALTGVMSLGGFRHVGADQSVSDKSQFLRGNNIAEGDKEERGFVEVVDKLMAKHVVDKMIKTKSFSALDKIDDLASLDKISAVVDDYMVSVFKFADETKKMSPRDLANELKNIEGVDNVLIEKAVGMYTNYLNGVHI
ncbi:Secreted RxLR effector peptide protein [Phytophthora palmivora]|uniref:RxLR effector protein n=1 Tax=Phytophthora palmivora TaxID=4796 RepID=A0A2P4X2A7_9STRA|nr:Secreted RxLR effector peptide protein [Phytophthora palmivora]